MAAEIKRQFNVDARLVRGSSGAFNVVVDNQKVFSKHDEGRFPKESEIIEKLRALQTG